MPLIFDRFWLIWCIQKKKIVKKNNFLFNELETVFLQLLPVRLHSGRVWRNSIFSLFPSIVDIYAELLLISLWTDTKLVVNLELREKFTRWKKTESFMITRAKISAMSVNSFYVVVEQFSVFLVIRNSLNKRRIGGAALIPGRRLLTFLSQMWRLFGGGA